MKIIKAKEFTLRPIRITDSQGYLECHLDKEAKTNFSSVPTTLNEVKKELTKEKKYNQKFAIIVKKEFAGFITLKLNNHPLYRHSATVGYGIHQNFRGKGLATQALKKITDYGFKELKLKRIFGMCRTSNRASARVFEKAGYKLEGIFHKNKFFLGKYIDDMVWARWK